MAGYHRRVTLAALERERRENAAPSPDVDPSLRTDSAKALVCARCGATITDARGWRLSERGA